MTSLFIPLQQMIKNRSHPLNIIYIISHTGPLTQGNNKADQLLIRSVLEDLEFHLKHHVSSEDKGRILYHLTTKQGNCEAMSYLLIV